VNYTHAIGPQRPGDEQAIDMSGRVVGTFVITDQAPSKSGRTSWWCLCLSCRDQIRVRRTNLVRAERGEWELRCYRCGARP
jgi:predicted SprT family Zn-dependent metalloprotease